LRHAALLLRENSPGLTPSAAAAAAILATPWLRRDQMRWTYGILLVLVALTGGFPAAKAELNADDRAYARALIDWTEEGRQTYIMIKNLPKGTSKDVYEKYTNDLYSKYGKLQNMPKTITNSYECRKNITYLAGWIKLFYDFRADSSKKHNMSPAGVKEYQDWTEKGYLKYYQECQRYFKTLKLSPSK
jgi:hypothetical protein